MREKRTTARAIVLESLARIATWEDRLNAVIQVNPRALEEADAPRPRTRRRAGCAARCTAYP